MQRLRDGLGLILLLCLGVRLAAWLVAPAIPLVVTLFLLVSLLVFVIGRCRGL